MQHGVALPFTLTCWAGFSGDSRWSHQIKVIIAFHRMLEEEEEEEEEEA